jgi:hypothetical protein
MAKKYCCRLCNKYFGNREDFMKHCRKHKLKSRYNCKFCKNLDFKSKRDREIHYLTHRCVKCGEDFIDLENHEIDCIPSVQVGGGEVSFSPLPFLETKVFKGFLKGFRHRTIQNFPTLDSYYLEFGNLIQDIIKNNFIKKKALKIQLVLVVEFIREIFENEMVKEETLTHYVNSDLAITLNPIGVRKSFRTLQSQIKSQVELFERNGSGWRLNKVVGCDIKLAAFNIFVGGCEADLPKRIAIKRAVINPKSGSNNCFLIGFLMAAHFKEIKTHRERPMRYMKFEKLYNFKELECPTPLSYVKKFEKINNVAINVFTICEDEEDYINIIYRSPYCIERSEKIVNLLYLPTNKKVGHWLPITSVSR